MRCWALFALTFVSACTGSAVGVPTAQHLQGVYTHPSGAEMRYLVWLPDGYGDDPDHRHPLIVFLHGSGDDDYDAAWVISLGLPAVLAQDEQPEDFDFVVVSPQAAPTSIWYAGDQPAVIDALVAEVVDTYLVDADHVYLTGVSMGGYGSWHTATRYPDRYAAMVSISGSGYQQMALPPADFACRLADVPIWAWHGRQDLIAGYEPIRDQVLAWERLCGATVRWTELADDGHLSTYEKAYRDTRLYEWLMGHSRSGPNRG